MVYHKRRSSSFWRERNCTNSRLPWKVLRFESARSHIARKRRKLSGWKGGGFYDAVSRCRPVKVAFSRPSLRSFATMMAGAATSQRTSAVPAKAPGAARLYLSGRTAGPTKICTGAMPLLFRCRANSPHVRQSRPDSGIIFQVKVLKTV